MANDLKWIATIDGEEHLIRCVTQTSLFDVYVDEELAIRVPRKMKNDDSDSEYDLKIGGKRCQFVLYDGVPDVAVDGILLGVEAEMARKSRRNRLVKIFGGAALIIVCSYAAFMWYVFETIGEPIFGGIFGLLGILVFMAGGFWMIISGLKKKKEY